MTRIQTADRSKRGRTSKNRGKVDEREVARILGAVRHPADTGGDEDLRHEVLSIQVRGGLRVVNETIRDGLAKAQATTEGKLPVLVLVDRAGTRIRRYAVLELGQFADYNGFGEEAGT